MPDHPTHNDKIIEYLVQKLSGRSIFFAAWFILKEMAVEIAFRIAFWVWAEAMEIGRFLFIKTPLGRLVSFDRAHSIWWWATKNHPVRMPHD